MAEQFLHGVEVIEIDNGPRPIRTVKSSVIGLVGTAPDADAAAFPLNTPVLVTANRTEAAKLDTTGSGQGTLPYAIDAIYDQIGAMVVVIRVEEGVDANETLTNVLGGVNPGTGDYEGVHALLAAQSALGVTPRILVAPGYTGDRIVDGVTGITVGTPGTGYTSAPAVEITGAGTGATATATLDGSGGVASVTVTNPGYGYSTPPTVTFTGGEGTGAAATATVGTTADAVVAELLGIAERMRAVIIADGPSTTDADAIAYRGDWGSDRVYVVDPRVLVSEDGVTVARPASARVAGLIAKIDNTKGFWWSPSNQNINGIIGTERAVDFALGDPNSRANYLNENEVATIVRAAGYRLWGNRTTSSDPKWAFLSVRRTADIINDSLLRAHLWAVDRNITRTYLEDVVEGVNAYLRSLTAQGAILGGKCWADPDLNTPVNISAGKVFFNFEFTPPYPAEHVTFRSHLVNDYIAEII